MIVYPETRRLLRLYAAILVGLLTLFSVACLVSLQAGWLKLDAGRAPLTPADAPVHSISSTAVGQTTLFSDFIAVDSTKSYRLSGLFRSVSKQGGPQAASLIYFGVQMYDLNRQPILTGNETYIFPAANGDVLTGLEGWVKLGGDVGGISNEGQNTFRPGTAWIRIVVTQSSESSSVVTEIADVQIAEKVGLLLSGDANLPK